MKPYLIPTLVIVVCVLIIIMLPKPACGKIITIMQVRDNLCQQEFVPTQSNTLHQYELNYDYDMGYIQ